MALVTAVHVLAGNLTQELPEVPDRGHDMSVAGKVALAVILAKRGAVLVGIRSLAFVMRDPLHTHRRGGIASSPHRLRELPPTELSRRRFFRRINAGRRWEKSCSVRPVVPGRTRVGCLFVGSSSLRFVPSYIGTGTNPQIDD